MAVLNTIITSQPCEICSIVQASEEIGVNVEYIYTLIRNDKLDETYPFPHGSSPVSGQKFVVKNHKYFAFLSHWESVHLKNPNWNKKNKRKVKVKRKKLK